MTPKIKFNISFISLLTIIGVAVYVAMGNPTKGMVALIGMILGYLGGVIMTFRNAQKDEAKQHKIPSVHNKYMTKPALRCRSPTN